MILRVIHDLNRAILPVTHCRAHVADAPHHWFTNVRTAAQTYTCVNVSVHISVHAYAWACANTHTPQHTHTHTEWNTFFLIKQLRFSQTPPSDLKAILKAYNIYFNRQFETWSQNHGDLPMSSDDSFHSPTVIPPLALDKPSIMKRYHHRQTMRWGVTARLPTMVTHHDTRFVKSQWWNDSWTVKTVVTWQSLASMIPALVYWDFGNEIGNFNSFKN